MMKLNFIKNPYVNSMAWGLIGAALMLVFYIFRFKQQAITDIFMLISFSLAMLGLFVTVRTEKLKFRFLIILSSSIITWMLMPILLHIVRAIQLGGYGSWWITPFFQMLGLGVLFCVPLTWLTIRLRKN